MNISGTIWITGLAGAGKTSTAVALCGLLRERYPNVVRLDGDEFRKLMDDDLGHDHESRVKNAYRLARMCGFLTGQGIITVCATMSLYPEIWEWNRANIARYFQVYLKVDHEVLKRRDQKKLYSGAAAGNHRNVVGVDLHFHEPEGSDMVLDNSGDGAVEVNAGLIMRELGKSFFKTWHAGQ